MNMRDHEKAFLVVQDDTLTYQQGRQDNWLSVGTPAWYAWLSTARTFAFRSVFGTFTARKEQASNKRGGWYWRAYRKREGILHRVYIGKAEEMTLDRLNAVAVNLAQKNAGEEDEHVQQGQIEDPGDREHYPYATTGVSRPLSRNSSPLPLPLTSILGREQEVAAAYTLLARPEVRFLTLTGTGGVGKTRLALQIASELQESFLDGVCFVSLAPIQDSALVFPTVVQALGLPGSSTQAPLELLK